MTKTVQIPHNVFIDLCKLFNGAYSDLDSEAHQKHVQRITDALNAKLDSLAAHELFTKYKTAAIGSDGREQLRKKYLEQAGIPSDFQTSREMSDPL